MQTPPEPTNETQIVPAQPAELATLGTAEEMTLKLADFTARREQIVAYIEANFQKGIDFGPTDSRDSKDTLKKPGAEKICRMFNTRPAWEKDTDTWEMLGNPAGVVCYICRIIDNVTGKVVGEGRGAEKVGNKQRDANKTIKNAEKCALVDAALYTFCLSEMFTQDDGGGTNKAGNLDDAKDKFAEWVGKRRRGCGSSMTDVQFIIRVIATELNGRKQIKTEGELHHISGKLQAGEYDWATGDKIPPRTSPVQDTLANTPQGTPGSAQATHDPNDELNY